MRIQVQCVDISIKLIPTQTNTSLFPILVQSQKLAYAYLGQISRDFTLFEKGHPCNSCATDLDRFLGY